MLMYSSNLSTLIQFRNVHSQEALSSFKPSLECEKAAAAGVATNTLV